MKNLKHAVYIGGFELPDKNAAAQRVIANGKLLTKLGYEVSYIGVNRDQSKQENRRENLNIDNFKFASWKQNYPTSHKDWLSFLSDISFLKNIIKEDLRSNVDIIVVYNYPSIALLKLIKYCKKKNIKLIADITEWYQPSGNFIFRVIKGLDSLYRMRILNKKLDGVITISKYLYNFYKDSNRILLPPLVDKNSPKWKNVLNSNNNNIRKIVYVGSPGNGLKDRLDKIILSLSRIKDNIGEFEFRIVGITKEEFVDFFDINLSQDSMLFNISFEGRKPHKEAIKIIKQADYSIFLRDNNLTNTAGFPTKFVESVSCNTPVITNASSNIKDFLKNGELGYLIDVSSNKKMDESLTVSLNQKQEKINYMKQQCFLFNEFHYEYYEGKMEKFLCNLYD